MAAQPVPYNRRRSADDPPPNQPSTLHGDMDIDLELALLTRLMTSPVGVDEVRFTLRPDDFVREDHALLYRAILDVRDAHGVAGVDMISAATRAAELEHGGDVNQWRRWVGRLEPTLMAHAVAPAAERLAAFGQGRRIARAALLVASSPMDVDARQALDEAMHARAVNDDSLGTEAAARLYVSEARLAADGGMISVPWPTIQQHTRGFRRGEVIVVAARTTVGKTWIMLEMLRWILLHVKGIGALMRSLEMPNVDVLERVAAQAFDMPPDELRSGVVGQDGMEDLLLRTEPSLARAVWNDKPCTVSELDASIATERRRSGLDIAVVFVDFLQLFEWDGRPGASPYEIGTRNAQRLKAIAKRRNVLLVVGSQLSRAGGNGEIKPTKDMMRESGAIEENCDRMIGAWRPGRADGEHGDEDLIDLVLLKNRFGRENVSAHCRYGRSMRIVEMAPARDYGEG